MKKIEWNKAGMQQIIDTGFKTFDRQNICIPNKYSNVIGGCMFSNIVRNHDVNTNGYYSRPEWNTKGYFTNYDLNMLDSFGLTRFKKHLFSLAVSQNICYHICVTYIKNKTVPFALIVFNKSGELLFQWAKSDRHYETIRNIIEYMELRK